MNETTNKMGAKKDDAHVKWKKNAHFFLLIGWMYYSNYCLLRFSLLDFECSMLQLLLTKLHFFLDIYCCKIDFYLEGSEQILCQTFYQHVVFVFILTLLSDLTLNLAQAYVYMCLPREISHFHFWNIFLLQLKMAFVGRRYVSGVTLHYRLSNEN